MTGNSSLSGVDLSQSQVHDVQGICSATFVLAVLMFLLRLIYQKLVRSELHFDDCLTVPSLAAVFTYFLTVTEFMIPAGLGKHVQVVGATADETMAKGDFILRISYVVAMGTIKWSILHNYQRTLIRNNPLRPFIHAATALVIAWMLAVVFLTVFQCRPTQSFWEQFGPHQSSEHFSCSLNTFTYILVVTIPDVATNLLVIILPIPFFTSVVGTGPMRLAQYALFVIGAFVTSVSVYRVLLLISPNLSSMDLTWNLVPYVNWTAIEINIGVVYAGFTALLPTPPALAPRSSEKRPIEDEDDEARPFARLDSQNESGIRRSNSILRQLRNSTGRRMSDIFGISPTGRVGRPRVASMASTHGRLSIHTCNPATDDVPAMPTTPRSTMTGHSIRSIQRMAGDTVSVYSIPYELMEAGEVPPIPITPRSASSLRSVPRSTIHLSNIPPVPHQMFGGDLDKEIPPLPVTPHSAYDARSIRSTRTEPRPASEQFEIPAIPARSVRRMRLDD